MAVLALAGRLIHGQGALELDHVDSAWRILVVHSLLMVSCSLGQSIRALDMCNPGEFLDLLNLLEVTLYCTQ